MRKLFELFNCYLNALNMTRLMSCVAILKCRSFNINKIVLGRTK